MRQAGGIEQSKLLAFLPLLEACRHLRLVFLGEEAVVRIERCLIVAGEIFVLLFHRRGHPELGLISRNLSAKARLLALIEFHCVLERRKRSAKLVDLGRLDRRIHKLVFGFTLVFSYPQLVAVLASFSVSSTSCCALITSG